MAETCTYTIKIKEQVNDELFTSEDMITYFKDKMKVKNSKSLALQEHEFKDEGTEVCLTTKPENIIKKDLKHYIKRYLRFKKLYNYIKVRGDSKYSFELYYVNKVDEDE